AVASRRRRPKRGRRDRGRSRPRAGEVVAGDACHRAYGATRRLARARCRCLGPERRVDRPPAVDGCRDGAGNRARGRPRLAPADLAWLAEPCPAGARGRAFATHALAFPIAGALGFTIVSSLGWRWGLLIALAGLPLAGAMFRLPATAPEDADPDTVAVTATSQ